MRRPIKLRYAFTYDHSIHRGRASAGQLSAAVIAAAVCGAAVSSAERIAAPAAGAVRADLDSTCGKLRRRAPAVRKMPTAPVLRVPTRRQRPRPRPVILALDRAPRLRRQASVDAHRNRDRPNVQARRHRAVTTSSLSKDIQEIPARLVHEGLHVHLHRQAGNSWQRRALHARCMLDGIQPECDL